MTGKWRLASKTARQVYCLPSWCAVAASLILTWMPPAKATPQRISTVTLSPIRWDGGSSDLTSAELALRAEQVKRRELAFAQTMADRDFIAFARFIDDHALLFAEQPLVGKAAVTESWRRYFEGATAPFTWTPHLVVVTPDGELAHSSGPVLDAHGRQVAEFNSVWRRQADGNWKVLVDKGCRSLVPPPATAP